MMKRIFISAVTVFLLTGCGSQSIPDQNEPLSKEISRDDALSIALENADVPSDDVFNVKIEQDGDNGIPVYDIEFETEYGDFDFEIAVSDGAVVGADYEIDEEWLNALGGEPVTAESAAAVVQNKVPGSSSDDIYITEENEDGRTRFEGELFSDGIKYEFEIDGSTGRIFDWNADLRS